MKKVLIQFMVIALVAMFASTALATNGYQLIGIGQIQKSLGGAVTAAPMDAMTAITNPAGMARIGSRADFSMEMFMPVRSVDFGNLGGESTEGGAEQYGIPAIGWTAPAFGSDDIYFGGGMYGTSGLGVDYDQTIMMTAAGLEQMAEQMTGYPAGSFSGAFEDIAFSGYSAIQFWKMAPTIAWNVNDKLSVGVALNMDYQSVTIDQSISNIPFWNDPMAVAGGDYTGGVTLRSVNFDIGRPTSQFGYGATMGVLYDLNDQLTLGASYSTTQSFDPAEFRVGTGDIQNYMGATGKAGTYTMDMDYPQQLAVGAAYKFNDKLMVTADIKWIDWAGTHDSVTFTGPANSFDTDGDGVGDASSIELPFGWEAQMVYAVGVQYVVNDKVRVRGGFNYGEAPIDEADVFNNLVFPAIVEQHITLGCDYAFNEHWMLALTYMKASSNSLTGTGDVSEGMDYMTAFQEDSNIDISLEEDSLGIQLSYLF